MNIPIIIFVVIIVITIVIWTILRNQKDKNEFENQINQIYPKVKDEEGES